MDVVACKDLPDRNTAVATTGCARSPSFSQEDGNLETEHGSIMEICLEWHGFGCPQKAQVLSPAFILVPVQHRLRWQNRMVDTPHSVYHCSQKQEENINVPRSPGNVHECGAF